MSSAHVQTLLTYVETRYPQCRKGITEAMQFGAERFGSIAETALGWLVKARGPQAIERSVDDFVHFTTSVNPLHSRVTVALSGLVRPCLQITHIMALSSFETPRPIETGLVHTR